MWPLSICHVLGALENAGGGGRGFGMQLKGFPDQLPKHSGLVPGVLNLPTFIFRSYCFCVSK